MIHKRELLLLLMAYIAVGLAYALATPPFEASDEVFHYPFVRHIALGQGLPVQQVGVKQPWEQVGSHPPAYYLLSAALTFWIDTSDFDSVRVLNPFARVGIPGSSLNANQTRYAAQALFDSFPPRGAVLAVWLIRLMSLGMGAGTVAATYALASALFPASEKSPGKDKAARRCLPVLSASLVAFNPMFLFISASVNNDNLVWLEAAAALTLFVQLVRGPSRALDRELGSRWPDAPALGLLLGLAAITKLSGLVLLPVGGLALILQALRTREWRRFAANGAVAAVLVLAVGGWWYARNLSLYHELFGLNTMTAIAGPRTPPATLLTILSEWRSFWYSYWGLFGAFTVLASPWVYAFYTGLVFAALAGGLWRLVVGLRGGMNVWRWIRSLESGAHLLLLLFTVITLISFIRWTMMTLATQGRLIFTALAPLSTYLAAGLLTSVPRRYARLIVGSLTGVFGMTALLTAADNVAAAYLPPAPLTQTQLPAEIKPVQARLTPEAELIGYTIDSSERLRPGDSLEVTLYWRALAKPHTDYNLFLHVLGRGRALVGSIDTWPGGGLRPTSFWQPGDIYRDRYVIRLDEAAAVPSRLWLDVAMWQEDSSQPLTITDAHGQPIPSATVPVGYLEAKQAQIAAPQHLADGSFEGGIMLTGYDIDADIFAGKPAQLTLYWQAADPVNADYTVFVHVRNAAGDLAAQNDGPPLGGDWPTSAWQAGRVVRDVRQIVLPTAGPYTVYVGLYDPVTVIPLIAFRADGSEWPDRAIELTAITVR